MTQFKKLVEISNWTAADSPLWDSQFARLLIILRAKYDYTELTILLPTVLVIFCSFSQWPANCHSDDFTFCMRLRDLGVHQLSSPPLDR